MPLIDIILGLGGLATPVIRLGQNVGVWDALSFVVMLLAGAIIIHSSWPIPATLSFWFVRVKNILEIFQSVYEAGRWPIGLYPGSMRFALTFIIPIASVTTVPAEALTGHLSPDTLLGAVVLTVLLLAVSRAL